MTLSVDHVMGKDCKLFRNTGTESSPTWNEVPNVRDLAVADSMTDVDVSARDGGGFAMSDAGLQTLELSFQMIGRFSEEDMVAFRTAYWARNPLSLAVATGAIAGHGTNYIRGAWKILAFNQTQNLEDVVTVDVTIKLTRAISAGSLVVPQWVSVTTTSTP